MKQNVTVYYFLEQYTVHRLCKFDLAQVVTVHKVVITAKLNINDHRYNLGQNICPLCQTLPISP